MRGNLGWRYVYIIHVRNGTYILTYVGIDCGKTTCYLFNPSKKVMSPKTDNARQITTVKSTCDINVIKM